MNAIINVVDAVKAIKTAILQSRYQAARMANAEMLKLYFAIGGYVSDNTRNGKWGTGAIDAISKQLQVELPGLRGFSASNIKNMRFFFDSWKNEVSQALRDDLLKDYYLIDGCQLSNRQTASAKSPDDNCQIASCQLTNRQLATGDLRNADIVAFLAVGFTNHTIILQKCITLDERWFYIHRCAKEFWSVETLKAHLRADDFAHEGKTTTNFEMTIPDVMQVARAVKSFKDEYLLDFVNLESVDSEEDVDERVLEKAIVADIQKFIMALGSGFCFVGNQYRLVVDEDEFFVDLLFFHRDLHCLVAIELKGGKFKPSYLGQLNFYLSALDEQVRRPDENPTIGLLLCRRANESVVELAVRDINKSVGVATYHTANDLPKPYENLRPVMDGVQKILDARFANEANTPADETAGSAGEETGGLE